MDPPPHQMFTWDTGKFSNPMSIGLGTSDTKKNFLSHGHTVRNGLLHMEQYPIMDPPHINYSCGTRNKISNPMGRVRN